MAPTLYFGPSGALKGVYNMLHGTAHTVIAGLLTAGTVYAARYPVDIHHLNLTSLHDLTIGIVYMGWLLFSLFAKQWLVTPEPVQTVTTQVSTDAPGIPVVGASGVQG